MQCSAHARHGCLAGVAPPGHTHCIAHNANWNASVAGLSHSVTEFWEVPGGLICHGMVTYTRRDGSTLTVPFANILKLRDGLIYDYRIFADISELHRQV